MKGENYKPILEIEFLKRMEKRKGGGNYDYTEKRYIQSLSVESMRSIGWVVNLAFAPSLESKSESESESESEFNRYAPCVHTRRRIRIESVCAPWVIPVVPESEFRIESVCTLESTHGDAWGESEFRITITTTVWREGPWHSSYHGQPACLLNSARGVPVPVCSR